MYLLSQCLVRCPLCQASLLEETSALLDSAVVRNDLGEVKTLLTQIEDINTPHNYTGNTALHTAAKFGRVEIAKELLKHPGININVKNTIDMYDPTEGDTPLLTAYLHLNQNTAIIRLLILAGATAEQTLHKLYYWFWYRSTYKKRKKLMKKWNKHKTRILAQEVPEADKAKEIYQTFTYSALLATEQWLAKQPKRRPFRTSKSRGPEYAPGNNQDNNLNPAQPAFQ